MDKRLVNSLLRVFHSTATRFPSSKSLLEFSRSYNVGRAKGASLYFSDKDKLEIKALLAGKLGIDAMTTQPEDWADRGRASALSLGRDEKFARAAVGEGELWLKAMPGLPLSVCDGQWDLPDLGFVGLDLDCVLSASIGHGCLLVVENKQTFRDLWHISHGLLEYIAVLNPLVVYRGDATGGSRADAVNTLILSTGLPVHAFVDYDPAGMVIAGSLPRLDHCVAPSSDDLAELLLKHGLSSRFMVQIPAARHALERIEKHPVLGTIWSVIEAKGVALPQEFFHQA